MVNVLEKVECAKFPRLCTGNGATNVFNTNIAFDRNGQIIARFKVDNSKFRNFKQTFFRYRKLNLFQEDMIDTPLLEEIEPFTTDFGEEFFTVICFDLLLKTPTITLVLWKNIFSFIIGS